MNAPSRLAIACWLLTSCAASLELPPSRSSERVIRSATLFLTPGQEGQVGGATVVLPASLRELHISPGQYVVRLPSPRPAYARSEFFGGGLGLMVYGAAGAILFNFGDAFAYTYGSVGFGWWLLRQEKKAASANEVFDIASGQIRSPAGRPFQYVGFARVQYSITRGHATITAAEIELWQVATPDYERRLREARLAIEGGRSEEGCRLLANDQLLRTLDAEFDLVWSAGACQ